MDRVARRDFLVQCGQGAVAALVPWNPLAATVGRRLAATVVDSEFHVHPNYREKTPLDALVIKRVSSFDDWVTEKYHDRIAVTLAAWRVSLLRSPQAVWAIGKVLRSDFLGSSMRPLSSKPLRPGEIVQVERITFVPKNPLNSESFLLELQSYLSDFSQVLAADFQVTGIAQSEDQLRTIVKYELTGSGRSFYREQRIGFWELGWQATDAGEYQIREWNHTDEIRSRSNSQLYEDITIHALGRNASYSRQLTHGVDYWRTILDGASRIDIYGHNGISVADIDGNGLDDFYVCQPAGLPNRLYRNRGDGTFEDITEEAGVGVLDNTACAIFADFRNSGHQDLVVVRANGPLLFLNEGNGKFREKPVAFQFATQPQGTFTGAAAADYNRDGLLDIYFCLYVYYQGTNQYKYPTPYYDANNGPPNFLMRNYGDGTFRDATAETGLTQNNTRYSFCCGWADFNGDGWPDLYVANDFGRKNLYRNNGNGTFTDIAAQAGVEDVGAGMSVCFFDYDNDRAEDLYVADMWTAAGERITAQENFKTSSTPAVRAMYKKHAMGNSLFRNNGAGVFQDETSNSGTGMGRWSWSSDAWDFDHDGFPDLYVTNGMVSGPNREDLDSFFWRQVVAKSPDEAKPLRDYEQGWAAVNELLRADYSWSGFERNVFYANNRNGTFSDVSGAVGLDFIEDGRAFALADFDGDGRLEVLVKNRNGPQLRLLKNVFKDLPASICFRLSGRKSNRDAIGASITIQTDRGHQTRMLQAGSGFLSQHSKDVFFGLGESKGTVRASIRWPNGIVQSLDGLPPNHRIFVQEGIESSHIEPFDRPSEVRSISQQGETLPAKVETWLLAPVIAPDFSLPDLDGSIHRLSALRGKPVLLHFWTLGSEWSLAGLKGLQRPEVLTVIFDAPKNVDRAPEFPALRASDDMAAIYNILYRSIFDRHRDLSLPISFLINEAGEIVKVYQGSIEANRVHQDLQEIPRSDAQRIAKALPFPTNASSFAFGRNYLSLGSIYFQRGYFDQAESSFRLALRDDPASAEAHYGLGSVYLKQAKSAAARASFEQAVKLNASYPDTKPDAWNNLGLLATREGRIDDAIGYFKESLHLDPEHLVSLENLGNAYRQKKRWSEARTMLERALEVGPDDPEVNYSLGMVFAQTDQPDRAYEYLQRALRFRPDYPEAMNNLGVLYLRTQRRDQAVAEFQQCIQVAPSFDQSYLNLARVYAIEGNRDKARETLQALLKQRPNHEQAQRALDELR